MKKIKKLFTNPVSFILDSRVSMSFLSLTDRRRKELSLYFQKRTQFYKKNIPNNDKYPFTIHNPYNVFEDSKGYEELFFVGENWLDRNSNKPIALMVGFNNWKYGFITDYLKEYRTVFISRKITNISSLYLMLNLNPKPNLVIVWGYTEPYLLNKYIKYKNIPLYRMEDGFIRSALLGATHATPYSLILDKKGLYYNPETESDIEDILNNYNFKDDIKLLEQAKEALELIIDIKISKYNTPSTTDIKKLGLKIKKRVVVLGQVDNDAALRYGNPDKWSAEELVKLARYENPEAEVIYRPHPEVYKGYQKTKFRQKRIENFAKIISPDEPLLEFLETVDHVYTINSFSGLEALLRGIKVTTVGAAFYAGWGLTDDRRELQRRNRKLSLLELFVGIYLKYPRYLADRDDFNDGLLTACYKIKADSEIAKFDSYKSLSTEDTNILSSLYWVQLFFTNNINEEDFNKIDFTVYLKLGASLFFQKIYVLSIFGLINSDNKKALFLSKIRTYVDGAVYENILNLILNIYDEKLLLKEISWLLKQNTDIEISKSLLNIFNHEKDKYSKDIFNINKEEAIENIGLKNLDIHTLKESIDSEVALGNYENILNILNILNEIELNEIELVKEKIKDSIYSFYEYYMDEKEFDKAIKLAEIMLIFGFYTKTLISKLVIYAKLRFDFESVVQLSKLNQNINLYAQNRNLALTEMMAYGSKDIQNIGENKFNCNLVKLITLKPNTIVSAGFIVERYKDAKEKDDFIKLLESSLFLDNEQSIRKAQAFIAINQATKAVSILENLINTEETTPALICAYTQALSFSDRVDEAVSHIELALKQYVRREIYHEAIRLYVLAGTYKKCLDILKLAENHNIKLGEMHLRKTYFGNRMPGHAFETFKENIPKKALLGYSKNKYIMDTNSIESSTNLNILFISMYGPGDEIRFASIYNYYNNNNVKISITCSPKLFSLFERSFPLITFVPTNRLRGFEDIDLKEYNRVKGSDLIQLMDNNGADALEKSDKVIMVTDLLHKILPNYESFPGTSYLQHDVVKTDNFKRLLPQNTKLVGISWRSSLTTHSRNEHYLSIEELAPLFEVEGITFVNFQYDECSDELAWVEEKYPGKMIDIKEVDHYDDLDSVASLMKCMNLMIAPATTVVELSGALGCPTWMFSNSSEIDWRKIDNEGTDVWHNSIKIVEGDTVGDKISLVKNLKTKLENYLWK